MKKLMFATSLAATVAALGLGSIEAMAADPLNAVGFESYQVGVLGSNGTAESNEFGTGPFFYFEGDSNSSAVSNDTDTASSKRTAYFTASGSQNAKYLALDTEGGTLWRSIKQIDHDDQAGTYGLGAAQAVAATGTYLDTLVQFTVTEDEAPEVGAGDKLAIWLQAGEGTTNLMVKAKGWVLEGGVPTGAATSFTADNVAVEPGVWYRLTVKAVQTVIDPNSGAIMPAFQIYIDGNEVAATAPQISTEMQTLFTSAWLDGMAALASANKLFPTLAEDPSDVTDVTLQGVGFQGTGAVDEIVWTDDDPFPAAVVEFTLTQSIGENVTAVAFTIGEDAITFENNTASVVSNATVTIAQPTFAGGYRLAALTVGGTPVADPVFPYSFTMTADTTVAITAELIPAAYPEYVGENATLRTQYDAWKQAVGFDDSSTSTHANQFLLNVDEETTVGDDALQIDSITEVQGGWDIVVSTTVTGAALSDGSATKYNGYLLVKAANDLAGLATATPTAYTVTPAADGKVKITVTAGKFMKAVLTTTAPAND